jgi:3-oxoacyl-[acyl-carrier protein] reductase
LGIVADATDPAAAEEAVTQTRETFGRIDILINNAGRGPREISEHFHQTPPKFWEVPPPAWERIVSTNVNGPYVMARAAAPHMVANGWGRIIGISTSRVTMVAPGFAPYGPTKAALDAMTSVFAKDLKGTGVTANILLPGGPTDTSFIPEDGRTGRYLNLLPVDIMNDALLWLVSDDADDVTGARLVGSKWQREDIMAGREDTGEPPLIL